MMGLSWKQIMSFKSVTALKETGVQFFKIDLWMEDAYFPSILLAFVHGHLAIARVP